VARKVTYIYSSFLKNGSQIVAENDLCRLGFRPRKDLTKPVAAYSIGEDAVGTLAKAISAPKTETGKTVFSRNFGSASDALALVVDIFVGHTSFYLAALDPSPLGIRWVHVAESSALPVLQFSVNAKRGYVV